ncbi:MFS transporter [Salinimonas marina]|uniref:MFS transporter n=1 Tax=Salinimonas marina TaxID=2785918 RepID=A0A7S9DV60_9ALTE|nr:MFS transporter [Salinimonas marina]QPG04557.1 MFS transporter [Salinimonas marina]
MNRNLFFLWQGQVISQLGMQAYTIAMMFWIMESSGSSAAMSVIFALSTLPQIIFGPIAGVIADRHANRKIIIWCDLIRGSTVLVMAAVLFSDLFSTAQVVIFFAVTACINGGCKAFFQPAIDAWIPDLTTREKLPQVMATFGSTTQATMVLGQASRGILFTLLGAPLLLLVDAVSYFLSALSECFIKQKTQDNSDRAIAITASFKSYKDDLLTGWRYLAGTSGMVPAALFVASINFFIAPVMLLLPFYVANQISAGAEWYGFLLAALALGSIIGYSHSNHLKQVLKKRSSLMLVSLHCFAFSLFIFSQSHHVYLSSFSFFTAGILPGFV